MSSERGIERRISAEQNNHLPDRITCTYGELDDVLDLGSYGDDLRAKAPDPDAVVHLERGPNACTYIPFPPGAEKSSDRYFDPDPPIFYEDIKELSDD